VGTSRSRSRLGLKVKRLGLVSVSSLRVSFTSDNFLIYSKQTEWYLCTQILFHNSFVTQSIWK